MTIALLETDYIHEYFITCIDTNMDKVIKLDNGYEVVAHVRKIQDLLYNLSKDIYIKSDTNYASDSINYIDVNSFDVETNLF